MSRVPKARENESAEHAFYDEMDQKTEKKSFCNCYTMAIFFGFLTIFFIILTIYLAQVINQSNITAQNILPLISDKIKNDEKILAKDPILKLVITADELNAILPETIKSYSLSLENPEISISESGMMITGKLAAPIKIPLEMTALVLPKEGKISVKVVKSKMGFISMPGMVRAGIEDSLNQLMDTNFAQIYQNYEVNNIELGENQMTIFGNLK